MIILGIDPGTRIAGYGVIESNDSGNKIEVIEYGEIHMSDKVSLSLRLKTLYEKLSAVIERTVPDECAVESAFYHKNVQSTLKIGHARGVALLAAAQKQIPVSEYSPREIKKAITGSGAASKEQVQFMICSILKIKKTPKFFDSSDALAAAICHRQRRTSPRLAARNWKQFIEAHPERVVTSSKKK